MSVKTDRKKEIYSLYQSSEGDIDLRDINSQDIILRELKKEIELRVYSLRAKWISHNNKYNCDIYIIELDLKEKFE